MSEEIKKEAQDMKLNLEELDKVSGGTIIENIIIKENVEQKRYDIYDDVTYKHLGSATNKEAAIKFAESLGVSTDTITHTIKMNF